MNRIDQKFKNLQAQKKKAFIAFVSAGDPNLKTTEELVLAFNDANVDIVELGVPFSDPLADGPTIQAASLRALKKGASLEKIFTSVKNIRKNCEIPLALMTYYNPIFHYGEEKLIQRAVEVGVDGVIVPDLPIQEAQSFIKLAKKINLKLIFFVSPTTSRERMESIVKASTGFIYYVSLTGVTGERKSLPNTIVKNVRLVKSMTKTPVCVGFGVSTSQHVKSISTFSDGVIVGSAIVKEIQKNAGKKDLVKNVTQFVRRLTRIL